MKKLASALAASLLLLAACTSKPAPGDDLTDPKASFEPVTLTDASAVSDIVAASSRLGLEIVRDADAKSNVVISPASLTFALGELAEGASGSTASSFDEVLGASGAERSKAIAALLTSLKTYDGDPAGFDPKKKRETPLLHVANQLVVDDDIEVKGEYLTAVKRFHDSGLSTVDLGSSAAGEKLSEWVSHHSGGLIKESAIKPDPNLRLVIQNAVLFAAKWQEVFGEVRDLPFTGPDGKTAQVPMMWGDRYLPFADVEGWHAVEMPYTEGFSAIVVLPPMGSDPAELTDQRFASLNKALTQESSLQVRFAMPEVDIETKTDLEKPLRNAGLDAAFDAGGFDGIAPGLAISQAAQQARLTNDKEGTVAAAVTEVGMTDSAPLGIDKEFLVDRPYAFAVRHNETGLIVFYAAIREVKN